jgi:hypothetical protein
METNENNQQFNKLPRNITLSDKDRDVVVRASNRKKGRPAKDMPAIIKAAAKALKQAGMSNKEIGMQLNLPEGKIQSMLMGSWAVKPEELESLKTQFAAQLAQIVMALLTRANTPEFIESLRGKEVVLSSAILIDKLQLMTGKATQITETKSVVEDAAQKLKQLEDLEKALKDSIQFPNVPEAN